MSTLSQRAGGAASLARGALTAAASSSRLGARRTVVTIPNPELDPSKGITHLAIRTFDRMPDMTQAFAIVRAVEEKYGVVLSMELPKDADTLRPSHRLFVRLLKPVPAESVEGSGVMEIPAPRTRRDARNGGPALEDVEAALRTAPSSSTSGSAAGDKQMIKFRLEPRRNPPREMRASRQRVTPTPAERREDDEIVRALQAFNGGFYGGLGDIADKFRSLVVEKPEDVAAGQAAEQTLAAEIAAAEAAAGKDIAEQKARAAAARAAAAQAAAAAEAAVADEISAARNDTVVDEDNDASARADKIRAKAIEAARVKARLDEEAAAAAEAEAAAQKAAEEQAAAMEQQQQAADSQDPKRKTAWRWFEKS